MKTRNDLRDSAMREIKRLSNGEELAADDSTYVLDKIDGVYAELTQKEIVYWDTESIPEGVMPWLTRVVAADIAGRYTSLPEAQYHLSLRGPAVLELQKLTTRIKPTVGSEVSYY